MKISVLVAALLLSPVLAQAGVLYEWRALKHETPYGITLRLEFDHDTVRSGAFSFHLVPEQPPMPRPGSGLLSMHAAFPGVYTPMTYFPRTEGFAHGLGDLGMELSFHRGGYLSGYIYANNSEHPIRLESNSIVFTVQDANSDQGMPQAGPAGPWRFPAPGRPATSGRYRSRPPRRCLGLDCWRRLESGAAENIALSMRSAETDSLDAWRDPHRSRGAPAGKVPRTRP